MNRASDLTGGGHSAELLPAASAGPQPIAGGLRFDGVDDIAIVDDFPTGAANSFTVAFQFEAATSPAGGFSYLYSHGKLSAEFSLNIYLTTAGTLRTALRGGTDAIDYDALDVTENFRDGRPHHYALTVAPNGRGFGATVYVDGVARANAARGGPGFDPTTEVFLGGRYDVAPGRHYEGALRDVRVYGRALDSADVRALAP